jgi:glutaredoxin
MNRVYNQELHNKEIKEKWLSRYHVDTQKTYRRIFQNSTLLEKTLNLDLYDFNREEILEQFPNAKTFPQIRVNGTPIGGFDKLGTYLEETGYNGTGHTL